MLNGYKVFSRGEENALELDRDVVAQHCKHTRYP